MNEKQPNLPVITNELPASVRQIICERTPEINMEPKEMYFRIGQRSVVRFLHQKQKEQSENIMEKNNVCSVKAPAPPPAPDPAPVAPPPVTQNTQGSARPAGLVAESIWKK